MFLLEKKNCESQKKIKDKNQWEKNSFFFYSIQKIKGPQKRFIAPKWVHHNLSFELLMKCLRHSSVEPEPGSKHEPFCHSLGASSGEQKFVYDFYVFLK